MGNQSVISEFLLLGMPIEPISDQFYALFLAMYLTAVLGNLLIMLIHLGPHLHTPMYLFLSNLSFSDLCFSSVTIPKLLNNTQSQVPSISCAGCLAQMYFFLFLESFLLVAMAYDHYVAICVPLHFTVIMSPKLCLALVLLSWVLTTVISLLNALFPALLSFCADNVILTFSDMSALLTLACSDIQINEMMIFALGGLVIIIPFLLIFSSCAQVIPSILKVPSARGIHNAFSTCGSHLSVVSLFYGTIIGLYLCSSAKSSTVKEMVMVMVYTVVTPMLNPFIYSLRNRDMKGALQGVFSKWTVQFFLR
ncbi:LOW QUALITY PROTEIN: olfactory receptor 1468-like [Rhynchonycteris naso]